MNLCLEKSMSGEVLCQVKQVTGQTLAKEGEDEELSK